jgi:hypothetical protein
MLRMSSRGVSLSGAVAAASSHTTLSTHCSSAFSTSCGVVVASQPESNSYEWEAVFMARAFVPCR